MGDVTNTQADEVASAQLAVDGQVEHGQISHLVGVLQVDADRPDILGLQRGLLANQLSLVLRWPMLVGFHD